MDALERILADEPTVTPSPRFAANVMAAVRREAAIQPAIAFPWQRALPGLVVCGGALVALVIGVLVAALAALAAAVPAPGAAAAVPASSAFAWAALALSGCVLGVRWLVRAAAMPE